MIRALVVGQSHTTAIAQAISSDPARFEGISAIRVVEEARRTEPYDMTFRDALATCQQLSPNVPLFLSMLGTYHNILGLLRSGQAFDFLMGSSDVPESDRSVRIPNRALTMAFEQHFAQAAVAIHKLRAAAKSPSYLLSSPPPKGDNKFMLDRLLRQKKQEYRGRSIREMGLEDPLTRLKLWKLETRSTGEWAHSQNIHFVPAPAEAFDPDGFLARELYSDDATHANARYGSLVLEQIHSIRQERVPEAAHG